MKGIEALQSVQFATVKGRRVAVLDARDWRALLEWLETLEDAGIVRDAMRDLKKAGGDRAKAGWLRWDDAEARLG